jgi:hypothetical protein
VRIVDPTQVGPEPEPHRRLSYSWHTVAQEWADINSFSDELLAQMSREPQSKVTFDIEPVGRLVKLTVVHDDLDPDSVVRPMISEGWAPGAVQLQDAPGGAGASPSMWLDG